MSQVQHASGDEITRVLSPELLHDLRTPLNHIIGFSELLSERAQEEGRLAYLPDLERVRSAGRLLLALLNDETPPEPEVESQAISQTRPIPTRPNHDENSALVLVVDDNEMNRDVLSRRLEQQGHSVVTVENGIKAMDTVRAQAFDLVLLDIMMPEMDGYEVLRQLKDDHVLRHLPVIMISAVDDLNSVVRCIELGAEDYLAKPFDPTLLKARIGASLDRKQAHDREIRLYDQSQEQYKRLQEIEKLRDNLTHMIIHDLRTPLSSVISGLQTMPAMGPLNDGQAEVIDIALDGGQTLLAMINGLLDVDKMESGAVELNYTLLDAAELVSSATKQIVQLIEAGDLKLAREVDSDLPFFEGDEDMLRRTLVNLLGNAIKFTPTGGTVTVAVRAGVDRQSLLFSISDTGEGIPEEAFERIFDKFGQVASRQSGRIMSTGLGLTFCKLAVEAHQGKISVANAPGCGSIFSFEIPTNPTQTIAESALVEAFVS